MKNFDKIIAKKLREEIDMALKTLGEKYDISFDTGSCTYSETEMSYKLRVKINDKEAIRAKEIADWNSHCEIFGFKKEDLGKEFTSRFEKYSIVGFELKRSKFDLRAKRISDGKTMLFVSSDIVKKIHGVDLK
jgi:hypothetical protein